MPPVPLEPGDPLRLGRYELTGRLGEGGQGVVYLGHAPDGTKLAVKLLRTSADPRTLERLSRELDAVHQVQPFVTAKVIEAGTDGARRYVVTEYIDGPSLQHRVTEDGPLRDGELHRLAVGTATALTAIHGSGVIHRDFKPANVLLGPDGPRVVDFGIARVIDTGTITSQLIGTPAYLAPEQLRGEPATPAADVFAWAVTITFAATGTPPFGADGMAAVMNRILHAEPDLSGVTASLRGVLAACLAKDPRQRPSARDLLVRLVDPSAAHSGPADPHSGHGGAHSGHGGAHSGPAGPHSRPASPHSGPPTAYADPRATYSDPQTPSADSRAASSGPVRRGHGRALLLACGAAAVLLGLGGWALYDRHTADPPADKGHASTGGTSSGAPYTTPTSPSSSTSGTGGATIPAAYAGTWSGTIQEKVLTTKDTALRIVLRAGGRTGEADYDQQACRGVLTLTGVNANALSFQLAFPQGGCVAGPVTLSRQGDQLDYQWHDDLGLASSRGPLRRTG
jgi:serine/threonine protein kinase